MRPSSFTLEATPMPVETNTNINASCVANEIRPEPRDLYWMLGAMRIPAMNSADLVDITYHVYSVSSTVTQVMVADDDGKTLTCVLVLQNGEHWQDLCTLVLSAWVRI